MNRTDGYINNYGSSYGESSNGCLKHCLILIGILALLIWIGSSCSNMITEDKVMSRLIEKTGTTDIVIIRSSNTIPLLGNPNDASYEVEIKGRKATAKFTSGDFSEIICTIIYYDDNEKGD